MQLNKTRLLVGTHKSCDIVIDKETVSKRHCELQWLDNGWTIKDLKSTNGTFVNGQRINDCHRLSDTDRITLGRGVRLELPPRPKLSESTNALSEETVQVLPIAAKESDYRKIVCGLAGLIAIIVVGVVLAMNQRTDVAASSDKASNSPSEINSVEPVSAKPADAATRSENSDAKGASPSAVWAVVVGNSDGSQRFLLGTAIAIESHRLLTLASIVDAANEVKQEFPVFGIVSPQDSKELIVVADYKLNPGYKSKIAELSKFRTDLDAKLDTISESDQPTLEESLDWSDRLNSVMENIACSDYAVVTTNVELPAQLPLADRPLSSSGACILLGFPAIESAPKFPEDLGNYQLHLRGRIQTNTSTPKESPQERLYIECEARTALSLESLACVDQQGSLLGICGALEATAAGMSKRLPIILPQRFWNAK